ncbi:MAG: LarC family nickel insertion protein [Xanthobacteraceae bacterium]
MIRRHVHLDAIGGIAGDMFVASMLDALPELLPRVMADIAAVLPPGVGQVRLVKGLSAGIGVHRLVWEAVPAPAHTHHHAHGHEHGHGVSDLDSGTFAEMRARIEAAPLAAGTATRAIGILTALAEAEAHIHGVPIEDVHFHEIADWDSLVDVVAAGSLIAALDDTSWSVSDLPLGGGTVKTRHGIMPVPAPATARLLVGFAWRDDGVGGERVTPTGAAILRHLDAQSRRSGGQLIAVGAGAGTRELAGRPNILRALVMVAEVAGAGAVDETVAVLSFDIDDMTAEEIGAAAERLRALDGVLDLSLAPLFGKKGRPLSGFRLLVRPDALDGVATHCLTETSSIGLRWHIEHRRVLARTERGFLEEGVRLRAKEVVRPNGHITRKAESDDLAAPSLAERRQLAWRIEDGADER